MRNCYTLLGFGLALAGTAPKRIESEIWQMRGKRFAAPTIIIAFLLVLYIPVFIWLVRAWLANPYYGHGFLILPVSAFIIWWKRKELVKGEPVSPGIALLVLGLALYIWGFLWRIRPLCAFSLLPVLFGLTLYFRGKNCARTLAFPICFLVFMIPLPFLDGLLPFLQSFTTLHLHYWAAL